ncbi:MAG: DUF3460 family protein [Casimicrobiaceae bacterium]|jgi:hypothetical protein
MPMLPARNYVSDHTQFIKKLMEEKPELPKQQREGREIWWDKTPDELGERRRMDEGSVAQRAYVYGSE